MMVKKWSFILFFSIFLSCISLNVIHAEVSNVKDCLEANEDCEELGETPVDDMENDDALVGNENLSTSSLIFNFIKMIFALLLVLVLIYAILTFIKKRNKLFSNVNVIENVGGITVGTHKSIQIVRIGAKFYLIGVGDNVEMLQEITDEEVIDSLITEKDNTFQPTSFIQSFLDRKKTASHDEENDKVNTDFTHTLESELNKLKDNRSQMINQFNKKDDRHE